MTYCYRYVQLVIQTVSMPCSCAKFSKKEQGQKHRLRENTLQNICCCKCIFKQIYYFYKQHYYFRHHVAGTLLKRQSHSLIMRRQDGKRQLARQLKHCSACYFFLELYRLNVQYDQLFYFLTQSMHRSTHIYYYNVVRLDIQDAPKSKPTMIYQQIVLNCMPIKLVFVLFVRSPQRDMQKQLSCRPTHEIHFFCMPLCRLSGFETLWV